MTEFDIAEDGRRIPSKTHLSHRSESKDGRHIPSKKFIENYDSIFRKKKNRKKK
jgi:hypothetical protein